MPGHISYIVLEGVDIFGCSTGSANATKGISSISAGLGTGKGRPVHKLNSCTNIISHSTTLKNFRREFRKDINVHPQVTLTR
jgi:hypothetical protein